MRVNILSIVIGAFDTVTKGLLKDLEDLEVGGRVETINDSIIENGQKTEKRTGDWSRFAVTQTPVKNHQLTLMWKTLKKKKKKKKKKMKKKSKCRLCGERDETVNHILSECSKLLLKEYKIRLSQWARWSTGKWARHLNLTIQTNGLCTTKNLSWKMRRSNSSGILRYKQIT